MARLKGIIKLAGTIGDITFAKTKDGYIAKEKTSVDAKRIATDVAFERTRENGEEFGRSAKAGKLVREAFRVVLKYAKDGRTSNRLTGVMMKVVKTDSINPRGKRTIMDGNTELLQGFDFNENAPLSFAMAIPYALSIDRATGELKADIPGFTPANDVKLPEGATHFQLVSAGAEIDFAAGTYKSAIAESEVLSYSENVNAFALTQSVTAGSNLPLFMLIGIRYFQLVNGNTYPLKNGVFNALSLVAVDKV